MPDLEGLLAGNIDLKKPEGRLLASGFARRGAQDREEMSLLAPNSQMKNMFFESVAGQVTPEFNTILNMLLAIEKSFGPEAVQAFINLNVPNAPPTSTTMVPESALEFSPQIAPPGRL